MYLCHGSKLQPSSKLSTRFPPPPPNNAGDENVQATWSATSRPASARPACGWGSTTAFSSGVSSAGSDPACSDPSDPSRPVRSDPRVAAGRSPAVPGGQGCELVHVSLRGRGLLAAVARAQQQVPAGPDLVRRRLGAAVFILEEPGAARLALSATPSPSDLLPFRGAPVV